MQKSQNLWIRKLFLIGKQLQICWFWICLISFDESGQKSIIPWCSNGNLSKSKWKIEIGLNKPIILCLQCQVTIHSAIFCEEKEFQFIFQSFLRTEIFFWTLIFSLLDKGFSILAWFYYTFFVRKCFVIKIINKLLILLAFFVSVCFPTKMP